MQTNTNSASDTLSEFPVIPAEANRHSGQLNVQTRIPSTSAVLSCLLRADLTTQWRNRKSFMLILIVPVIIMISWKGVVDKLGSAFVLGNCITIGLIAIGLNYSIAFKGGALFFYFFANFYTNSFIVQFLTIVSFFLQFIILFAEISESKIYRHFVIKWRKKSD